MQASDIMTRSLVTAGPEATVEQLARLMVDHHISAVPIVQEDKLLGIVSEGDLLRRAEAGTAPKRSRWLEIVTPGSTLAAEYVKSHARHAVDVMSQDVVTVSHDTPIAEIAALLEKKRIKRVPVLQDGKLVGLVSRANLIQVLASGKSAAAAEPDGDRAIRDAIMAELRAAPLGTFPSEVNVIVRQGVVHLFGMVGAEPQRHALRVAAENAHGVTSVEDHTVTASAVYV